MASNMAVSSRDEPLTASSVISDDNASNLGFGRQPKLSAKSREPPWKVSNEASRPKSVLRGSQRLESRLAEILQSEEWDQLIQSDPARSHLLSQLRMQLQGPLEALAYIQDLENHGSGSHDPSLERLARREDHEAEAYASPRQGDAVVSPRMHRGSDHREWKLDVKRWKRVDGGTGSTIMYDESENIEDIRKRERDIRGGGYVLNVYDVYEAEGKDCQTLLEISSGPLLVHPPRIVFPLPQPNSQLSVQALVYNSGLLNNANLSAL